MGVFLLRFKGKVFEIEFNKLCINFFLLCIIYENEFVVNVLFDICGKGFCVVVVLNREEYMMFKRVIFDWNIVKECVD